MFIELDAIFGTEGQRQEFDYEFVLEDEVIASPVHIYGSVYNKTGIVTLKASAEYSLNAACARCGDAVKRAEKVDIDHILIAHSENDDNDYYIVVENMRLDLNELVSEDIFLSMPSRYLCSDNCRGLCPVCGANLNKEKCSCKKIADPRWDVLNNFFDN
ncbi:MAG: DUF177 domain-containing protein [Oscillospiraceae bacterium]|nr:DUF177 domain-containing protein [Oscillospiraceae bacterium]